MLQQVGELVEHYHGLVIPPQGDQCFDRRAPIGERQRRGGALIRTDAFTELAQRLGARPANRAVVEASGLPRHGFEEERFAHTPTPPHDSERRGIFAAGDELGEACPFGLAANHPSRVTKPHGALHSGMVY